MDYYEEIKNKLTENEIYSKAKDYSKEKHRVETYFEVGKMLSVADKHYGENIIGQYALKLQKEVGKKYDKTMLSRMMQLFLLFSNSKVAPAAQQLTWSHIVELLSIKDINKINYYIDVCNKQNLSRNKLRNIIKSNEYERLPEETKKNMHLIKEYLLRNINLYKKRTNFC